MSDQEHNREQEIPASLEAWCSCANWVCAESQGEACRDMIAYMGKKCKRVFALGGVLAVLIFAGVVLLIFQLVTS